MEKRWGWRRLGRRLCRCQGSRRRLRRVVARSFRVRRLVPGRRKCPCERPAPEAIRRLPSGYPVQKPGRNHSLRSEYTWWSATARQACRFPSVQVDVQVRYSTVPGTRVQLLLPPFCRVIARYSSTMCTITSTL